MAPLHPTWLLSPSPSITIALDNQTQQSDIQIPNSISENKMRTKINIIWHLMRSTPDPTQPQSKLLFVHPNQTLINVMMASIDPNLTTSYKTISRRIDSLLLLIFIRSLPPIFVNFWHLRVREWPGSADMRKGGFLHHHLGWMGTVLELIDGQR